MSTDPGAGHQRWHARYQALLADAGLDSQSVLNQALSQHARPKSQSLSLAQVLSEPQRLKDWVLAHHPDAQDPATMVAHLSVLHQNLALNVLAPLVLLAFRDGHAPVPEPERIGLVAGPGHPDHEAPLWYGGREGPALPLDEFVHQTGIRVSRWYGIFRNALGISPGAYWSNTALALVAPFSAIWNRADPDRVCALGAEWLDQFPCDANRYLEWLPVSQGQTTVALPQRRGCCLKYRLPDGRYCGTCGVYRKQRRAALSRPVPPARQAPAQAEP